LIQQAARHAGNQHGILGARISMRAFIRIYIGLGKDEEVSASTKK